MSDLPLLHTAANDPIDPQTRAADPLLNAFVTANAGAGKTTTLVRRVARLLLHGARPEGVLCVTYTKAAAAEMQTRLFETLGEWAVATDEQLRADLREIGAPHDDLGGDLSRARRLFAQALETPGGLKIQTLHAFCEQLLRRFPLEAGLSPGFTVMDDADARVVAERAREDVAHLALRDEDGPIGRAYEHLAVELDGKSFEALLKQLDGVREGIAAYAEACRARGEGVHDDVWRVCGFSAGEPRDPEAVERAAVEACQWAQWREHAAELARSNATDGKTAEAMFRLAELEGGGDARFAEHWRLFSLASGQPKGKLAGKAVASGTQDWLAAEQARLHEACQRATAARQAVDTVHVLTLGAAYVGAYACRKAERNALDFSDLTQAARRLLTESDAAAWVLFKLDGGIDHVLVDEAQDTSPAQWDVVHAIATEFFAGEGQRPSTGPRGLQRTVFAVGDKKQSIYSFQGAAPERLTLESQKYDTLARRAGRDFEGVALEESFRSTPQVLAYVDAVFAEPQARTALGDTAEVVRHTARRLDHAGQIDLWPLLRDEKAEEADAWEPLDAQSSVLATTSARKRLAYRIAAAVARMTERKEAVYDKSLKAWRAARPGDVLILVRRRDALFEEIIRALKRSGLPVAGADRLKLSRHIVFKDVLALIRFALFPWDDLTVAALLRSPFCGVSEEELFDLAQPRGKASLYSELNRRSGERPAWRDASAFLSWARNEGLSHGPFDFLSHVLTRLDGEGRSQRRRLVTRLGEEAQDAAEALLAEALSAESKGITDLERFALHLERSEIEVKREMEGAGDQVRVMTVHGAKGLEAPIVILPDAATPPRAAKGGLLPTEDGGWLFAPRSADDTEASAAARARALDKAEAESLRLLYVALTRARDRVIVCGRIAADKDAAHERSWYARLEQAFDDPALASDVREVDEPEFTLRRYGPDPETAPVVEAAPDETTPLPDWAAAFAPTESPLADYASPSTLAERRRGPAPSPLAAVGGLGRFRRGDLIHKLLQRLPDLPAAVRADRAAMLLAQERDLTPEQRREMAAAALGVLEDPRFAPVWGDGGRAEAAVAGHAAELPPGLKISGRVDRMVVTRDRVLVVDFKTNRPSPDRIEQADPSYLMQMAIYVAVLREIFPGRTVEAALVWTDGPKLMPVPEATIAWQLAQLRRLSAPTAPAH